MIIDLHSHSTISDGTLTPSELLAHASKQDVDVLALTDHDSVDGLEEAAIAATELGIQLINGVEISTSWNGQTIHMVGLGIDPTYQPLLDGLQKICEFRLWRAEEMGRRLAKKRIEGGFEGAKSFAKGGLIARTHYARFLVDAGYCKDIREVFKKYLVPGKPGYVPGKWADIEEAVSWVRGAGGIPIIAHPARYRITAGRLRKLLSEFKKAGGLGVEVVSGSHNEDETRTMANTVKKAGLLASQGSDYHGPENTWVELGRLRPMPDSCKTVWESEFWPKDNA